MGTLADRLAEADAYRVAGYGGIAWHVLGPAKEWTEEEWVYSGEGDEDDEGSYFYNEPEEIEDSSRVRCVMVGDDRVFVFDVEDVEPIAEEDYCPECGQIGCMAYR